MEEEDKVDDVPVSIPVEGDDNDDAMVDDDNGVVETGGAEMSRCNHVCGYGFG